MKPTELSSVQKPIIEYVGQLGWHYVSRVESDVRRGHQSTYKGRLFYRDLLMAKLREFNPWLPKNYSLPYIRSNITGNLELLRILRGQSTAYDEQAKRERNVIFIDLEHPERNVFEVTDEFSFSQGNHSNRQDIVFLINGIPVIVIECKNITAFEGIEKALDQIRRYHRESSELLAIEQIFLASEGLRLEYGVTWNTLRRNIFSWKGDKVGELENKIKSFFDIKNILNLIEKYILFVEKDEELTKIILREHQVNAVEAVISRALQKDATRGLIWHTQGSGKTFTMIKTAELLFKLPEADKPTVIMMLDRNELEDQMEKNLRAAGLSHVRRAESIHDLVDILKSDYRGIVICMIHKFRGLPANLNIRKNIFVLIDEAHRTTGSDLGTFMMAAMPNATFIGYTGTPIDKIQYGKGTFKTFGINDPKGYLHKYSIKESIEDGTTLPLYYTLASSEMLVPKEMLENEVNASIKDGGVTDVEAMNKILEHAVNTKNFIKGQGRIEKIGKFVAEHFKKHIEPMNYKAFLVAVDRKACVLYKKELDKYLPKEWSEVVYSDNNNDGQLLKEFSHDEQKEKEIRRDFAKFDSNPKILIVTEKLLTGYDAPILYCMYLDKPLRDHALLQAIARVNRPYENEKMKMIKPHGFIIDFIGIFHKLEDALSFDSDEVKAVVKDIVLLKECFVKKLNEEVPKYLSTSLRFFDDRSASTLIEYFRDQEKRKGFFKLFKEIEMLYEIISPDAFLRPYIDKYTTLVGCYLIVRNAFSKHCNSDRELQNKTSELVRDHIQCSPIKLGSELIKLDENGIEVIKEKNQPDDIKIINLIKSIQKEAEKKSNDPVLLSVRDRANDILDSYNARQVTTQKALALLIELVEKEAQRCQEQERLGISSISWFIHDILTKEKITDLALVADMENAIIDYSEFSKSEQLTRDLKNKLYDILEQHKVAYDIQKRIIENILETLGKIKL